MQRTLDMYGAVRVAPVPAFKIICYHYTDSHFLFLMSLTLDITVSNHTCEPADHQLNMFGKVQHIQLYLSLDILFSRDFLFSYPLRLVLWSMQSPLEWVLGLFPRSKTAEA